MLWSKVRGIVFLHRDTAVSNIKQDDIDLWLYCVLSSTTKTKLLTVSTFVGLKIQATPLQRFQTLVFRFRAWSLGFFDLGFRGTCMNWPLTCGLEVCKRWRSLIAKPQTPVDSVMQGIIQWVAWTETQQVRLGISGVGSDFGYG